MTSAWGSHTGFHSVCLPDALQREQHASLSSLSLARCLRQHALRDIWVTRCDWRIRPTFYILYLVDHHSTVSSTVLHNNQLSTYITIIMHTVFCPLTSTFCHQYIYSSCRYLPNQSHSNTTTVPSPYSPLVSPRSTAPEANTSQVISRYSQPRNTSPSAVRLSTPSSQPFPLTTSTWSARGAARMRRSSGNLLSGMQGIDGATGWG